MKKKLYSLTLLLNGLLFISNIYAAENAYTGEFGNTLLECIVYHYALPAKTLTRLMQINKHLNQYTKPYYTQCMKQYNTKLRQYPQSVSHEKIAAIHTDQAASILFLQKIDKRLISSNSMITYLQAYVNGEGTIKLQSHYITRNVGCTERPHIINNMFCIGYGNYYIQSDPMHLNTLCIDARTGKQYRHPFATRDNSLTHKELLAVHSYFLRDYCSRISYYKNTIRNLPDKSQYKLFKLFANYGSITQTTEFIRYCCYKKKGYATERRTFDNLYMSFITEYWHKKGKTILDQNHSVFLVGLHDHIAQFKKEANDIHPTLSITTRLKAWQQFKKQIKNRITVKKQADRLLRYDALSNSVRIITCGNKKNGIAIEKVSDPILIPHKDIDPTSLEIIIHETIRYKLRGGQRYWTE